MGLADLRKLPSIKEILDKQKKVEKPKTKQKAGNSLIARIQNITSQVQTRLGKYEKDFELITTETRLHEYIDKCIENGIISIDTETTGLDPICDQIVGACIYTYNEKAAYIPINHISYITNVRVDNQLNEEQVAKEFQRLVDAKTKVIMFNAKFDIRVIRNQLGVYMTPSWCGFIAGKCLKENEEEGNLKYLWKKYCSPDKEAEHFTFDKMFEGLKFNIIPISSAYLYAAKDALMTMELYDFQKEYLDVNNEKCKSLDLTRLAKLYHEIELPIINVVADIEDTGVAVDLEYIEALKVKYHKELDEYLQVFYKALEQYQPQINAYLQTHPDSKIETPLNVGSSVQLAELFYDVLKLPSVDKKQPRGTGEPILKALNHPLSKLILDYRGAAKLVTTYIDKMPEIRNKKTGKIHCSYNQYGADCVVGDTIIPNIEFPGQTIEQICESNIFNMECRKFYPLQIHIINKFGQLEITSHAIKFEHEKVIKLVFDDGSDIIGTYNHPILMYDNIFKELQYINMNDIVLTVDNKQLKVIKKCYIEDVTVYDFKVPGTHSFVSNHVISHNTGRFSSNNPNLQNIPSHDKNIRKLFIASRESKVKGNNNIFNLYIDDIVPTIQGEIKSQDLKIGDTLICDDGKYSVKNINIEDMFVTVEV